MAQEGWICPKCGRALAPWMSECPCNYISTTITCSYTLETSATNTKSKGELQKWPKMNSKM